MVTGGGLPSRILLVRFVSQMRTSSDLLLIFLRETFVLICPELARMMVTVDSVVGRAWM